MDNKKHAGLDSLQAVYFLGSAVAAFVLLCDATAASAYSKSGYSGLALVFLIWGGLVVGSAHLALKKGREFVEGMILGAFGPLGFLVEVLLPPAKTAEPARQVGPPEASPALTVEPLASDREPPRTTRRGKHRPGPRKRPGGPPGASCRHQATESPRRGSVPGGFFFGE